VIAAPRTATPVVFFLSTSFPPPVHMSFSNRVSQYDAPAVREIGSRTRARTAIPFSSLAPQPRLPDLQIFWTRLREIRL